jgi:hypothetical protein
MSAAATGKLLGRAPLPVNPARPIAIKRDVHEFEIAAPAERFARAFEEVVTDPASTFGLIRVKRPADRLGQRFTRGERFQGSFSFELAAGPRLAWLFALRPVARVATWLEDQFMSDYAEIVEFEPLRLRYRYLDGTPIAGSSTFTIEPLGPDRCRFTQIFEFQEINGIALRTFQSFGLKYHDQVVWQQVRRAAAKANAAVLSRTIPEEYS